MKKIFLLMISLLIACAVSAQVTTSGINGVVTDANGDPLPGATIIAVHTPSGTQYGAVANKDGRFNLQGLRAGGPYTVTFSFVGYQGVEFPNLTLQLGETLRRDAFLKDSQTLDAVVVTADGSQSSMNINRAGVVTSISAEEIELMPSTSRSMNDIMKLTPQSSSTTSGLAIGGGNYRQSAVTVDGASFNNNFGIGGNLPAGGTPISLDALEQVSVSVTPYDVRQSGFTGGAISAVTKSGTNDVKIGVYNYYKSDVLQGDRYKGGKLNLNEMKNDVLGFNIGMPILKDKLFLFTNFEYEWDKTPAGSRQARPDGKTEYGDGTIYNRPTVAQMDEISSFLKDNLGYVTGPYQNYSVKSPGWKLLARLDWNINKNHALNIRFSTTKSKYNSGPSGSISPFGSKTGYSTSNNYGRTGYQSMTFAASRYFQEQNFTSVAAELNSRFMDGRLTNLLRYTYSYQNEPRSYDGQLFPTVDILEPVPGKDSDEAVFTSLGLDPFTNGNLRRVSTHIVTDEVGFMTGIHTLTGGIQFEHNYTENGFMPAGSGYYIYNSWNDFVSDVTAGTNKARAFSIAFGNNKNFDQTIPSFKYMQTSLYAQDQINFSERLKVTLGVRLEVPIYPALDGNENAEFTTLFKSLGGYKTSDMPKARLNVSPRVGFNWDMTGERKYILRGGTGIFTGRIPFVWIISAVSNSNCIQNSLTMDNGDNQVRPGFYQNPKEILNSLYPNGYEAEELPAPQQPTIMDRNLKMPSTWKTSLALDIKLPRDFALNIEGIYNKDINSVTVEKLGQRQVVGGIQLPIEPEPRMLWESQKINNSIGQSVNPYLIKNADIDGYYFSFTGQLSKKWKFGLYASASYTYSNAKNVIDGIGDQITSAYKTNTFCKNGSNTPELGYSSYVSPHRILVNLGYRKEYGGHFASNVGLFYEAFKLGYIGGYSYSRYSYTMSNATNDGGADVLLYVPTKDQWEDMVFKDVINQETGKVTYTAADQKADFWQFVNDDDYLSNHKGEYTKRGAAVMPWHHSLNFKFAQDFYFNVKGKRNTLTVGLDITNIANLINRDWGNFKQLSGNQLLSYSKGTYQYKNPKWTKYASTMSTWSAMFSVRYTFN